MKVEYCRLCKTGKLSEPKLKFPATPLANEFVRETTPQDLFPLEVCVCQDCGHYQLNESVDPERLFRDYFFVAGTSPVNVEHFRKYAVQMVEKFNLKAKSKVLDIASNDGVLLRHFKDLGMEILGIDPAKNLAEQANKDGIPTIPEFFTEEYADKMLSQYGQFDLITANNVFAHVPDLADFAKGVKKILSPNGVFVFEVSYFADVCDKTLFDTVYHEHSSYHTLGPLNKFFRSHGLCAFDVQRIDNHGGSIRVYVQHKDRAREFIVSDDWISCLEQELDIEKKVEKLALNIRLLGLELREKLRDYSRQGNSIAIYGVPAKATTLMYALGIKEDWINFAVDDAPLKQGTFTPGMHISVLPTSAIYEKRTTVILVLAWNFADSIIKKHSKFPGKWIVPIPELKEY